MGEKGRDSASYFRSLGRRVHRVDGLGYNQQNSGSQITDVESGIGTIGMGAERVVEIGWAVDSVL